MLLKPKTALIGVVSNQTSRNSAAHAVKRSRRSRCRSSPRAGHCAGCVSHVLSILDPDWPVPDALGAYGEHTRLELRFHDVIKASNPCMIGPQQAHVENILVGGTALRRTPSGALPCRRFFQL